jgi:hypothetical protein
MNSTISGNTASQGGGIHSIIHDTEGLRLPSVLFMTIMHTLVVAVFLQQMMLNIVIFRPCLIASLQGIRHLMVQI